ncbi:hypothetical protein HOD05_00375 [Candidatus Woesearchaeota archaeon]|nr:hypothetical protein [Candidatus Woesearchaeota archaeon]MBT4150864.1 hypothetical protein [Candidatus Woesearchaeota archaeon]MBT4246877.1 hypothetical protein [Candidatus Woesearchaeota archaeon]MBT4433654.1 hypothetical protein [Candidatus Woesearchaeota archaeon]
MFTYLKNKVVAPVVLAAGLAVAAYAPSVLAKAPQTTVQVQNVQDGKTTYNFTTKRTVTIPSNASLDDVVGLPQKVTPVGLPDGATKVTMARGVTLPGSATPVGLSYAATPVTITKTITNHVPTLAGLPEVELGGVYGVLAESNRNIQNTTGIDIGLRYHPTGRDWSLGAHVGLYSGETLINKDQVVKDAAKGPLAGSLTLTEDSTSDAQLSATALGLSLQNNTLLYNGSRVGLGLGFTAGVLSKETTWNESTYVSKAIDGVVMQGAGSFDQKGGVDESISPYVRLAVPIRIEAGNGHGVCVTPTAMISTEGDKFFGVALGYCRGSESKK